MRLPLFVIDLAWGLLYRFVTSVDEALDCFGGDDE